MKSTLLQTKSTVYEKEDLTESLEESLYSCPLPYQLEDSPSESASSLNAHQSTEESVITNASPNRLFISWEHINPHPHIENESNLVESSLPPRSGEQIPINFPEPVMAGKQISNRVPPKAAKTKKSPARRCNNKCRADVIEKWILRFVAR